MNALTVFDKEGELVSAIQSCSQCSNASSQCRNYTCCGRHLNDLHALLEHFEEVHIVVLDPSQPPSIQIPFNPKAHDTDPRTSLPLPTQQQLQNHIQNQFQLRQQQLQQQHYPTPVDPDDMELDLELDNLAQLVLPSRQSSARSSPSSCATTPPDTPISTPLSAYPSPRSSASQSLIGNLPFANYSPFISAPPSPPSTTYDPSTAASTRQNSPNLTSVPLPTGSCRTNLNIALASGGFPRANSAAMTHFPNPEDAFNVYARFASDYSSTMPGAQFNAASCDEASAVNLSSQQERQLHFQQQEQNSGCMPPALLFASTNASRISGPPQQGSSGSGSAALTKAYSVPQVTPPGLTSSGPGSISPSGPSALSATRPPAPLLLSKPFKCPKPNCNKSYKQANGLKYHLTHGSCNFAPPKDLEHVKDLLERKRREKEQQHQHEGQQGANLTRSTSLGSAPTPAIGPIPMAGTSSAHAQTQPPTPSDNVGGAAISPTSILGLTYNELSNISESDLREVEREAERRLRPFACGVGDCQRRYKNMNGLRYHYQHSGDHGAIGLALLASGQHECLGVGKRHGTTRNSHHNNVYGSTQSVRGSVSVPVSRAGSVPNSRVGTPQPQQQQQKLPSTILPQNLFNLPGGLSTPVNSTPNSAVHTPTGSSHPSPLPSPRGSPDEVDEQPSHQIQQHQQQTPFSQLAAYHYAQIQRQYRAQMQVAMQQHAQAQGTQSQARYAYDPSPLQYAYLNAGKEVVPAQEQPQSEAPGVEVASFPGST